MSRSRRNTNSDKDEDEDEDEVGDEDEDDDKKKKEGPEDSQQSNFDGIEIEVENNLTETAQSSQSVQSRYRSSFPQISTFDDNLDPDPMFGIEAPSPTRTCINAWEFLI